MPINGLTDVTPAMFPELGQIRKGDVKSPRSPGRDLNEDLRFTTQDQRVAAKLSDLYPTTTGATYDQAEQVWSVIVHGDISIMFLWPTVDQNWSAWQEEYVGGVLHHRCDGTYVVRRLESDGKYRGSNDWDQLVPCPGGCKPRGRMAVYLPALGLLGYFSVATTSKNDIKLMTAQLPAIADFAGGQLGGIACDLGRRPYMVPTPPRHAGGARIKVRKWLLNVAVSETALPRLMAAYITRSMRMVDGTPLTEPAHILAPAPLALIAEDEDEQADPRLTLMINRIYQLLATERDLGGATPPNELAIDLAVLTEEEVTTFGKRVKARLALLQAGETETYTVACQESELAAAALMTAHGMMVEEEADHEG